MPFLVSRHGYGVLWDNLSFARFGDLREFGPIPADCPFNASGQSGGLTTGTFTLYEDDGLTYGYERGALARIPMRWNDATKILTIGRPGGSFPGMLTERTFEIVFVTRDKPVGLSFMSTADRTVRYTGGIVAANLK